MSTYLFFGLPTQPLFDHIFELGLCGKPIFRLDSDFENPNRIWTVQVFQIRVDGIPTETACNLQFKLILSKILSFNVQIENVLKHDRNRVFARNWNGGGWSHDWQSRSWIWCLKHCTPCHAYIWLTQVHIYCTVISNSDIKFYSYDVTKNKLKLIWNFARYKNEIIAGWDSTHPCSCHPSPHSRSVCGQMTHPASVQQQCLSADQLPQAW